MSLGAHNARGTAAQANRTAVTRDALQETGRAGRDGLEADCILFYNFGDKIRVRRCEGECGGLARASAGGGLARARRAHGAPRRMHTGD